MMWATFLAAILLAFCAERTSAVCQNTTPLVWITHDPQEWRLFVDSSTLSLKAVLLHSGNRLPSIPLAHAVHMKETYDNLKQLLHYIDYNMYKWHLCGDLKRNYNITCPDRAICADVFRTRRDWLNGTACNETRILHNCLCTGGTVCPYNNEDHRLYASAQQEQYVCQPICQLPFCGNVRTRPNASRVVVAQTLEQGAPEFASRNYYRMSCRCPRHHSMNVTTHGVQRAVQADSHKYDYNQHRYSTQYICTNRGDESTRPDPCGSPNASQH